MACDVFCESCGDCLHCYGEDPCSTSADGKHVTLATQVDDMPEGYTVADLKADYDA